jgi:hypothetical protein
MVFLSLIFFVFLLLITASSALSQIYIAGRLSFADLVAKARNTFQSP